MGGMIGYVGLSHLGIVSSIATAAKGFSVLAVDPNVELSEALNAGKLPVFEPGLADLLAQHRQRIGFTADARQLKECAVVFLSRDIPTDQTNQGDLRALDELIQWVIPELPRHAVLVVLSQVRPGYLRRLARHLAGAADLTATQIYYQVETLIFGNAVERALRPERFIVGCADPSDPLPPAYAELLAAFGCPVLAMRYESAELAKTAINLFLVASVTTTNMLAELCEAIGADWGEIQPTLRLDRRIGPHAYLAPGLGVAGGNLERDLATLKSLADEAGTCVTLIDAFIRDSRYRQEWVLRKLGSELTSVDRPLVAIWGLAYKPNTRSTKNSPAVALIHALLEKADWYGVRVFDPEAQYPIESARKPRECKSALEACQDADVVVVMTPWSEFTTLDLALVGRRMKTPRIIDPFGCLSPEHAREAGFSYSRLGARQNSSPQLLEAVRKGV